MKLKPDERAFLRQFVGNPEDLGERGLARNAWRGGYDGAEYALAARFYIHGLLDAQINAIARYSSFRLTVKGVKALRFGKYAPDMVKLTPDEKHFLTMLYRRRVEFPGRLVPYNRQYAKLVARLERWRLIETESAIPHNLACLTDDGYTARQRGKRFYSLFDGVRE